MSGERCHRYGVKDAKKYYPKLDVAVLVDLGWRLPPMHPADATHRVYKKG